MKVTITLEVKNESDIGKNINAQDRAILQNPYPYDTRLLLDTRTILEGIKKQLEDKKL